MNVVVVFVFVVSANIRFFRFCVTNATIKTRARALERQKLKLWTLLSLCVIELKYIAASLLVGLPNGRARARARDQWQRLQRPANPLLWQKAKVSAGCRAPFAS